MTLSQHNAARPFSDHKRWELGELRQRALTDLLMLVVRETDLYSLMREVARKVAGVLAVEFSSVFEFLPETELLLLREGVGWDEGEVGQRTVEVRMRAPTDYLSQAGYTLFAREAVLAEDLSKEASFDACPLMRAHDVKGSATAKIWARSAPFGVIGAHSRDARTFTDEEKGWLLDVADVLGDAVARDARRAGDGPENPRGRLRAGAHARFKRLRDTISIVAASTGGKAALEATARVAVRDLADWCFIDLLQNDGLPGFAVGDKITRMVVGPPLVTRGGADLARHFSHEYALDPTAPHGTAKVLRGGRPELIRAVDEDTLREIAADDEDLKKLRQHAPTSYLAVPLRTKGRNVGALVLVSTNPRATFDEDDLSAAEDLASCAALVLSGAHDVANSRLMEPELGPATSGRPHPEDLEAFATQGEPAIVAPDASMDDLRATLRGLTERQLEILRLLAEHHTPKTIARRLVISEKTVRRHVERINQNLGVNSYREAVLKAKSLRIVT